MPFFRSLIGFRPTPRDDAWWTSLEVQESSDGAAWSTIDTQVIDLYADRMDPPVMQPPNGQVNTSNALLEDGYYRLRFLDDFGGVEVTEAVDQYGVLVGLPASGEDVRSRSELIQKLYPADPYDANVEAALREAVADAVSLVESLTCRDLSGPLGDTRLDRLAIRAITLKSERIAAESSVKSRRAVMQRLSLKSFTAGPYSETYFGPGEATNAKTLDLDPALHEVLWALATEECRQKWLYLWGGEPEPASGFVPFRPRGGYGRSYPGYRR